MGSRGRLLRLAISGIAAFVAPRAHAAPRGPLLTDLTVSSKAPFFGDGPRLATLGTVAGRETALLRFRLGRPAVVRLETLVTGQGIASEEPASVGSATLETREVPLRAGRHSLSWTPDPTLLPRTYVLRLRARAGGAAGAASAVVRILGVDAGLAGPSTVPGGTARLVVRTDAEQLTVQVLRCGAESEPTNDNITMHGEPVTDPQPVDWSRNLDRPADLVVPIGSWPSGLYAIRLEAADGRIGFAPLVVRPRAPERRVAVVLPTTTWQAYNFYDSDGDGWGDTWYARWKTDVVDPTRPHANRGVPHRYRSYDLQFIRWLCQTGKDVDVYADEDIAQFPTADVLRAAYDLLVFPGHTEYVTTRLYDLVTGFRDRGGNLAFLSANNFFRRVDRRGSVLRLVDEWRDLGRPEAALCGVQYVGSDRGGRQQGYTVVGADVAPWAFEGTGLTNADQFGIYGIEADARAASSPPGTQVLATIRDLFGAGRPAEMTYYEHASGARVFSAGVLNFGGQVLLWPEAGALLENVWRRLAPSSSPSRGFSEPGGEKAEWRP